jgi:hypothetical protein
MKWLVSYLMVMCCLASPLIAQEVEMTIYLDRGTAVTYNIDSIAEMHGTGVEYPWTRLVEFEVYMSGFSWPFTSLKFTRSGNSVLLGGLVVSSPEPSWQTIESVNFPLTSEGQYIDAISDLEDDERMALWHDSLIYGSSVCKKYIHGLGENTVKEIAGIEGYVNIELNDAGDRMTYSHYPARCWQYSEPTHLIELNLVSGVADSLPTFGVVTSARYLPGSIDLIYFSKGSFTIDNPRPADAGYYLFDRASRTSTQILSHPLGISDAVNGFDISQDGQKLLVPSWTNEGRPVVFEYNIATKQRDTIRAIKDETAFGLLWLQFSSNDSLILYSDGSNTGIINRGSSSQRIIHLAPSSARPYYIPYPRWSPDDKAICYGAASIPEYVFEYIDKSRIYIKRLEP